MAVGESEGPQVTTCLKSAIERLRLPRQRTAHRRRKTILGGACLRVQPGRKGRKRPVITLAS